ncbi:uncharacterized protein LOC120886656 [Ictidomys tridecemlineatus]
MSPWASRWRCSPRSRTKRGTGGDAVRLEGQTPEVLRGPYPRASLAAGRLSNRLSLEPESGALDSASAMPSSRGQKFRRRLGSPSGSGFFMRLESPADSSELRIHFQGHRGTRQPS